MSRSRRSVSASPGFQARRLAMLALFEDEFRPTAALSALERLGDDEGAAEPVVEHARVIVAGVLAQEPQLDVEIAVYAPAIPVSELGRIERTILRSAVWEMLYSAATSTRETIRDAVSLAGTYAGEAARRLVNGVLRSIAGASGRGG
ncbi:MAG: transcription antitermination protein NusB [Chloroflexota bacterium]|nr:transcription antitermination protein NusB [Chloroflexota bacterium]